jgi:hypothetical protein
MISGEAVSVAGLGNLEVASLGGTHGEAGPHSHHLVSVRRLDEAARH